MLKKIKYYQLAKEIFDIGGNIVQKLMSIGVDKSDCIEIAYEIQAGSYTTAFHKSDFGANRNSVLHKIIKQYSDRDEVSSVGVFGVGEAVNWIGFDGVIADFYGVELSYSRLRYARSNVSKIESIKKSAFIKGDASETIFEPNSFDLTMTLHSIEPNGDVQGEKILRNVINCSSKYIILFEPDYSSAPNAMKERMKSHNYVCNIEQVISNLQNVSVVDKFLLDIQENDDNTTTCWVLRKKHMKPSGSGKLVCPYSNGSLIDFANVKYSPEAGLVYPIIDDIMFINKSDAVFIGGKDLENL